MMASEVPDHEALRRLRKTASPYMRERLDTYYRIVKRGKNLGEALDSSNFVFPNQKLIDQLQTFAKLKSFDVSMHIVAKDALARSVSSIKARAMIAGNLMLGVVVGLNVWILAGVFSMSSQMQALY
jgi:hypothetical protein